MIAGNLTKPRFTCQERLSFFCISISKNLFNKKSTLNLSHQNNIAIRNGGRVMFRKVICALAVLFFMLWGPESMYPDVKAIFQSSLALAESPSLTTNYRSIGTQTGNLAGGDSSTASVGQGLTVVTFTGVSLPANVGLGDKLTLDPSGVSELGYILSRDSDTQVTLQSAVQNDYSGGVVYTISRSYTTIQSWEDDREGNLVSDDRREVGVAYNDGPFYETVRIDGSTTDSDHYMQLRVADGHRHNGTAGTGAILDGEDTRIYGIQLQDDYTCIEGLEIKNFRGANGAAAIEVEDAANVLLSQLLIHDFASPENSVVGIKGSDNSEFTARNCIIFNGDTAGIRITQSSGTATVQNCTVFGMDGRGIYEDDGILTVTNTISMGNSQEDFDIVYGQQSYNLSSDDTAQGAGSLANKLAADQFVSITAEAENLHLKEGSDAIDAADDLSAEFSNDIDDEARPAGPAWDMGADEYISETNSAPTSPSDLYCNDDTAQSGQTNPTGITDLTPAFSAVYNDPDSGDVANKYSIEINTQSDFNGTVMWDSGAAGTSMPNTTAGSRCQDIIYAGSSLSDNTTYYWRIRFWDDSGAVGAVSSINNFTTGTFSTPTIPTNYRSIGTQAGNLAGGDASTAVVSLGSSTVTFSGISLPAAIGKGDKLTLDPAGINEVGHILSRDNDTQVTLQSTVQNDYSGGVAYTINRAYNTIQVWEDDRDGNLVSDDRKEVGVCYNDGPFLGGSAYALVTIDDSITDADHFMCLTVADGHRHDGTAGTGVVIDGQDTAKIGFRVRDAYTRIDGLEIKRFRSDNGAAAIEVEDAAEVYLSKLLIHDFDSTASSVVGIKGDDASEFTVRNCIIYDGDTAAIRCKEPDSTATIENCTIYGMDGYGIYEDDGSVYVKNTVSMGNTQEDFDIVNGQQSYNLSSDATAVGTGCLSGKTASDQFVSITPGAENLHLKNGADAIDAAEDLSTNFTYDIDNESRPIGAAWDLGADEFFSQANTPPVAIDDTAITIMELAVDIYVLANDTDADDDALSVAEVTQGSNGTVVINPDNTVKYTPNPEFIGTDNFTYTVSDGNGGTDTGTVTVTVNMPNSPPTADAGPDQTVNVGDTVVLDGSGSSDPDNDDLTYQWSFVSVPQGSTATLSDPASVNPTFVPDIAGTYEVQLIVNDGSVNSAPDVVVITANPIVQVPDVVGMHQTDAEAAITAAGLTIGILSTAHDNTVPIDHVISQDPASGSSVAEGSAVDLVVSLGPVMVTVPAVVGQLQADAEAAIIAAGLTVGTISTANSDTVPIDHVISQSPAGGSSAAEGSPVDLVVSLGPVMVTVPDVVGMLQSDAEATITAASLTVGTIGTALSSTVPLDHVISHDPAAGASVAEGTLVNMLVSLGPAPEDVDFGLDDDDQQGGNGKLNDSVCILIGNVTESRTDIRFASAHRLGLSFAAFYNSRSFAQGALGFGWTHTYSLALDPSYQLSGGSYLKIVDESGRGAYFTEQTPGVFTGEFKERSYVKQEGGDYVWHRLDGTRRYGFSADGKLVWIDDETGNRLILGYNGPGNLETVTDTASSRALTFHYANGLLDHIEGPTTTAVSNGIWVTFGYDGNQNLTSVTYADGSGFTYTYTDPNDVHNLTEKKNSVNHLIATWQYDVQDRCFDNFNKDGRGVNISYVSATQADVTDEYSVLRTYTIGIIGDRKRVTSMQGTANPPYSDSNAVRWVYDNDMNLIEVEYSNSAINQYLDFDERGNPGIIILAAGTPEERSIAYTYHPAMNVPLTRTEASVLGAGNKVTTWDYDNDYDTTPNENPTKLVSRIVEQGFTKNISDQLVSYEYVTTIGYDDTGVPKGQVDSIDGPRTDVSDLTTFTYYPNGDLETNTRPQVGTTSFNIYDDAGQVTQIQDVNNLVTGFSYDGRGRITATTYPDTSSSSTTYVNGLVDTTTDEDGITKDYNYDSTYGRLYRLYDIEGNYIQYLYDAQGNLIERSKHDPTDLRSSHKRWDYSSPDIPGMLWKEINADETYTEYRYNNEGNLQSMSDPQGNITEYGYDTLNRLKTVAQTHLVPGDTITAYQYDGHGNLILITDAEGHVTTYTYDDMGQAVSTNSPDTGTTTYAYNEAGNLIQKTDAKGAITQYSYDALNRLTLVDFDDASEVDITYSYDQGQYGKGNSTGMIDSSGSTTFGYDRRGRLVQKTSIVNGYSYSLTRALTPGNRISSISYPSGRTIDYTRHSSGKIEGISTTFNSITTTLVSNISYNPFAGPKGMTTSTGGTVSNQSGECDCLEVANAGAPMEQVYAYDANRNLTSILGTDTPWLDQTFTYDSLNRLGSAAGVYGSISFTYDKAGNRLTRAFDDRTDTYSYITGTNRLEQISGANPTPFSYDANGNITAIDTKTFVYNQNNRLIRVEDGVGILGEYTYNGLDQRVLKEAQGVATVFHYDFDGNIIAESQPGGTFAAEYLYLGRSRLAKVDVSTDTHYYYLNNYLGTPIMMTDDTGMVAWEAFYKPYGEADINPNSDIENNFRFAGQYFDEETGLHYNWQRYYDPKTGRYLTPDPVGLKGGINLFAYTFNNPVNTIDPDGRFAQLLANPVFWAGVAAIVTYAVIVNMQNDVFAPPAPTLPTKKPYLEGREKSKRGAKPKNAPPGTIPIDKSGLSKEDIHRIKDGIGAGPRDWTGISPDGDVISGDSEGNAINNGPYSDYLPHNKCP